MDKAGELAGTPLQPGQTWEVRKMWQAMLEAAPKWLGATLRSNRYGLDVDYFTRKMMRMVRDMADFTPSEMARQLARMSKTADETVLSEPEFSGPSASNGHPSEAENHE